MATSAPRNRAQSFLLAILAAAFFGGAVVLWWAATQSPEAREAAAEGMLAAIHVRADATEPTLLATRAVADFGIGQKVGLVVVRILDGITLDIEISADRDIVLAGPPSLCFFGPDPAPDDAGLSDRCWGEPDLTASLRGDVELEPDGHVILGAADPLHLELRLERGDRRCDYPPGLWTLAVDVEPVVGGIPMGARSVPDVAVDVPWTGHGPLPLIRGRYCGLASLVYRTQGEPSLAP
jgi:hypothetical protein